MSLFSATPRRRSGKAAAAAVGSGLSPGCGSLVDVSV